MPQTSEPETVESVEHGIASAHWDNLGRGWRILCLCGWGSACNELMAEVGEEFDDHLESEVER